VKYYNILDLKPTQMAFGLLEVELKIKKLRKLMRAKNFDLKASLKDHSVSVVIAPNKEAYIVDGHHRTSAIWMLGIKKVYVKILADYSRSDLSYHQFWKVLEMKNWTHLFDQCGHGPHSPLYLPQDIRGMGVDPYRDLAYLVRSAGGFEQTTVPFAEFEWANFFRRSQLLDPAFELNFDRAQKKALKLAKSSAAKKLPGYLGVKSGSK